MEILAMSTGRVRPKRATRGVRRYLPGAWSDDTLPINVFVVTHDDGMLLFDAGQSARAATHGYLPAWHPFLRLARFELAPEDEVASQLGRLELDPAAVRWVVLSHLHTDHVGGLEAFRHAEVLVSPIDWQLARGLSGRLRGYLPHRWPQGLRPRPVQLTGPAIGPFPCSSDVAGDGRLVIVPIPGHTPGHLGLLARADAGTYLTVGDLVHTAGELDQAAPEIAAYCRAEGIIVLPSHDPSVLDLLSRRAGARS